MSNYTRLLSLIDETREQMTDLLLDKGDPMDPEVIKLSQELDKVLNDYHKLLKEMER
ncbi:aspartyl-phosphate phosphatase Spo0E family protein [Clostridium oryzae]|uniref:Spo0E like sporulation regulatory protein n=1 Tax=Clostridium oryzae TaxID=1450648 RepID=A0A1V4IXL0_9CLOT|nr:aspartyl-phosphate phosphatase Spo0E family protein [Clostridium oryzae]OPJ64137.1 Spo0E like sporulation regulatory protein [Clostridium oryzae]